MASGRLPHVGAGMGTPHCPGPAGVGTAALRSAQLLSHPPHPTLVPTVLLLLTLGRACAVCPGRCVPQGRGCPTICTPCSPNALSPSSWCWQSSPAKAMPTLLQPMLVTSRESPAWLQVSAVPLPQTLPSGPGKAGGGSWLHAASYSCLKPWPCSSAFPQALPAWLPPLPQTGARGLPAPGPAHPTAGVDTALPQPTQPGLCLSPPLPAPPQCRGPCRTLFQQLPVLWGPGRSAVVVSPSP